MKAEARIAELEAALATAADDLGKAANQFASIRASQEQGHSPNVVDNPEIFEGKEQRARAVLASLDADFQTDPRTSKGLDDARRWTISKVDGFGTFVLDGPDTSPPKDCGLAGEEWLTAARVEVRPASLVDALRDELASVETLLNVADGTFQAERGHRERAEAEVARLTARIEELEGAPRIARVPTPVIDPAELSRRRRNEVSFGVDDD